MVIYTYAQDSAAGASKFQIACIADGSIAAREYNNDGWGDWSMTPSYLNAYPNLSSLASALGGLQYKGGGDSDDMDTITAQGIYYVSEIAHLPSGFGNGMLVVLRATANRTLQIIARTADSQMYWRMTWEDYSQQGYPIKWFEWNRVTTDMPAFYKSYNDLSSLATALKAIW